MPGGVTATRDLAIKLGLERQFKPQIRGLFAAILRNYRDGLARGRVIDVATRAGASLERLLLAQYRRVGNVFAKQINAKLPRTLRLTDEESATLEANLEAVFSQRAVEQAIRINLTTQRRLDSAVREAARLILDDPNIESTPENINSLAVTRVASHFTGRVNAIACFETQWSAEASKVLEVAVLVDDEDGIEVKRAQLLGRILAGRHCDPDGSNCKVETKPKDRRDAEYKARGDLARILKTWRSQGDSRVRVGDFDHLFADGQQVTGADPFIVSSEELLWPGDSSRGASLGNVISCRCSAEYETSSIADLRRIIQREDLVQATGPGFAVTESEIVVGGGVVSNVSVPRPPAAPPGGGTIPTATVISPTRTVTIPNVAPPVSATVPATTVPAPVPVSTIPTPTPGTGPTRAFLFEPSEAIATARAEIAAELGTLPQKITAQDVKRIRNKLMELNGASSTRLSRSVTLAVENRVGLPLRNFETSVTPGGSATSPVGVKQSIAIRGVVDDMSDGLMNPRLMNPEMTRIKFRVSKGAKTSTGIEGNDILLESKAPRSHIAHEFGHHIESRNPEIRQRMVKWRNARTNARRQSVPAEQFNAERKAIDSQWGQGSENGGFFDTYVNKVYPTGDTEILSMAIEGLYNPQRLTRMLILDREHFELLWATLRGF